MSDKAGSVDFQEALSIKVGRFLLSKGLDLASSTGIELDSLDESDSLGILHKNPDSKPIKYLFGLFRREPRREFLGTIWFSNSARGATEEDWVLDMYGREHVDIVMKLAEEMASLFNVKIAIHLVSEQPDFETFLTDYDM